MNPQYPEVMNDLHIARNKYELVLSDLTNVIAEAEITEDYQKHLPQIKKLSEELKEVGGSLEKGLKAWLDKYSDQKG